VNQTVTVDPHNEGAKTLTNWAKHKGLIGIVAYATPFNTYLLVENGKPIFENPRLEDCAVHLDIMALDKVLK
jgi:hypothetical protein